MPNYALIMSKNKIIIGLVQAEANKDIDANLEKTAKYIHEASKKGADIVCFGI